MPAVQHNTTQTKNQIKNKTKKQQKFFERLH